MEETLTFDEYTGELIKKNAKQQKIINKGFIILEDVKMPQWTAADTLMKWCDEGKNKNISRRKWSEMIDTIYDIRIPKGQICFRSKIIKSNGVYCLYPNSVEKDILRARDILFGYSFPVCVEHNPFVHWRNYLERQEFLFKEAKMKEIKTEELTFEQLHIIPILEANNASFKKKIDKYRKEIYDTNEIIKLINS